VGWHKFGIMLDNRMDALTAFGLFAVTAMLICYVLEDRSHWLILGFAGSCALGSAYGFLQLVVTIGAEILSGRHVVESLVNVRF
jgi:hypothetical protein